MTDKLLSVYLVNDNCMPLIFLYIEFTQVIERSRQRILRVTKADMSNTQIHCFYPLQCKQCEKIAQSGFSYLYQILRDRVSLCNIFFRLNMKDVRRVYGAAISNNNIYI